MIQHIRHLHFLLAIKVSYRSRMRFRRLAVLAWMRRLDEGKEERNGRGKR